MYFLINDVTIRSKSKELFFYKLYATLLTGKNLVFLNIDHYQKVLPIIVYRDDRYPLRETVEHFFCVSEYISSRYDHVKDMEDMEDIKVSTLVELLQIVYDDHKNFRK